MEKSYLGNEWNDWKGQIEDSEAGRGMFLFLSFITVIMFSAFILLVEYLIGPRLYGINHYLPLVMRILVILAITLMITGIFLLSLAIIFGVNLFGLDKKVYMIVSLIPYVNRIAKRFGISKDRIGNSFIKINNAIVRLRKSGVPTSKLLVLLPRCLSPEVRDEIYRVTSKYDVKTFILAGGEAARVKVKEFAPKAIVAVACERDLVGGIKDVPAKIKVLGVPNKRPKGPCANTIVDIAEFEKSIRFFLQPW